VKYAWIEQQRAAYPLPELCEVMGVSISGYRAWRRGGKPGSTRLSEPQAVALIKAIHAEVKGAYGSRRMHRELKGRGHRIGLSRVERLMREHGVRARHKRRYKATTDSKHSLPVADNVLARNFTPDAPNRVWSGDITYIATDEGWLYLAVVLDLFNREVVGWSLKPRMTADIVTDALTMAWFRRKPAPGVLFHSDRGSQYASHAMRCKLNEFGMTASMSRKGNCWDNAPTESFFNSLKNERVYGARYATRQQASADVFQYIEGFYNRRRRHSTLGYCSPEEFLRGWLSKQQAQQPKAA
jgi:transposase InsO family protein